jgi:hypothetical protein
VRGRVVDFWLVPLSNVPVTIGTTTVMTNANGEFTIIDVAPQYDVSMVVRWSGTQAGVYGWKYEGLTRRDPTLQVRKGRGNRYANFVIIPQNATIDASRNLSVVIAGMHGSSLFDGVGANGLRSSAYWVGPTTMQATAHALLWELDSNDLPTAYRSYDSVAALLDDSSAMETMFNPSLADETIASGTVSGTVVSAVGDDRANLVFVRFPDGGSIELVNDYPPPSTFSYLVPTLPGGATITVAASYGFGSAEYAVAHRDGLAAGQANIALTIPTPVLLDSPESGTIAGPATTLQWSAATGAVQVIHIEDRDYYQGAFVVTRNARLASIPTFEGFELRPAGVHLWNIETHGSFATVDAFAGPEGGLDSMGSSTDAPMGPKTGSGTYTQSLTRSFTWSN